MVHLDISTTGPGGITITNDGTVVCSDYNNTHWIFTTIEAAGDWTHPVSGNREFGYTFDPNNGPNGSYTFFARGVDRITESIDTDLANWFGLDHPFLGADNLWNSFQYGLEEFVDNNGGVGTIQPFVTNRPNWEDVKDVLLGNKPISDLGCE